MGYKLSIVVPCYNEEQNIPFILEKFNEAIKRDDVEIILVNNGSTDGSAKVMERLVPQYNFARISNVEVNQGYGFGILSGLEHAQGEFLGWTHADLQTDPADVIRALELIENNNNDKNLFVKGKRRKRKLNEIAFSVGMQIFASIMLRTSFDDINAQPKVFSRDFYDANLKNVAPYDFSLDLFALYKAKKHTVIKEIPVWFNDRQYGEAKGGGGSDLKTRIKVIKRTLKFIIDLASKI